MIEKIAPANKISGTPQLPGDKSISHRALMIGAIAEGTTNIENLSPAADVRSTLTCLQQLGIQIETRENHTLVHGHGLHGLKEPNTVLDAGNSGTTMRLLSGILAGQPFTTTITGDESLRRRPMKRIIEPLRRMGARIQAVQDDFAPLTISGSELRPIRYEIPVASAQVKSCLLFAGLYAEGQTEISEPFQSRDHTERMLQYFGANLEKEGLKLAVTGPANLGAQTVYIPGDLSSAAFFVAAALLLPDSEIMIQHVGMNPTRRAYLDLLIDMGADISILNFTPIKNEFMADLLVRSSRLRSVDIGGALIPQLIDELPILTVLATQAEGVTRIQNAAELRKKESDRIHALALNLQKMGASVRELDDGLIIEGPTPLKGNEIETFGDHRIAMAFAIAGLIARGETTIHEAECVDISFPGFFHQLRKLVA